MLLKFMLLYYVYIFVLSSSACVCFVSPKVDAVHQVYALEYALVHVCSCKDVRVLVALHVHTSIHA
jgi:hypothetical protein